MDVFGSFTLLLAFVCAVYAFAGGIGAIITRHPLLVKSTRQAGIATCVLIFIGTFSLEYLLFSDNFSLAYVVSHSNRSSLHFLQGGRAVGRAGRFAAVLELPPRCLRHFRSHRLSP